MREKERERDETIAVSHVEERDARRMTHGKETVQEIVSACIIIIIIVTLQHS